MYSDAICLAIFDFIPAMMNIYYMNDRKKYYKIDFVRDLLIRIGTY